MKLFLANHFHVKLFWIPAKPELISFCAKGELKRCQKHNAEQDTNFSSKNRDAVVMLAEAGQPEEGAEAAVPPRPSIHRFPVICHWQPLDFCLETSKQRLP